MRSITQEDHLGCGVACTAFVLRISYQKAKRLFKQRSTDKAQREGFFCKEIVAVLNKQRLNYSYKYLKEKIKQRIYKPNTIVFIKRSLRYPSGHYLCRNSKGQWMDPWINFPSTLKKARSGFRKRLPGRPIYAIIRSPQ